MDCGAMSVNSYLQRYCGGPQQGSRRSRLACARCLVKHDGHKGQQLPFTQVRMDCCSKRAPFYNLGRSSGYGVMGSAFLEPCRKSLSSLGFWGSFDEVATKATIGDSEELEYEEEKGDAWLVDEVSTPFNQISVLELDGAADHELAGAYVLKLDKADLAHSVFWSNGKVWSGGCHDVFASLPPLLPEGPVAILGLGAGTVARLLLHLWPSLHLEGWELDPEVVRVARQYFGLGDLESTPTRRTKQARSKEMQRLVVHVGDALGPEAVVEGGFAGIMVDIFINGTVCRELGEVTTWRKLKHRLRSGGRIMVNCIPNSTHLQEGSVLSKDWDDLMHNIVQAMEVVYPGEVCVRELSEGNNVMLLSGGLPDPATWSSMVPDRLVQGVHQWKLWNESHPRHRSYMEPRILPQR